MSITSTIVTSIKVASENYQTDSFTLETDNANVTSDSITGAYPAAVGGCIQTLAIPDFTASKLQACWLNADQDNVKVSFGGHTPLHVTISGMAYSWVAAMGQTNPFTMGVVTGVSGSWSGVNTISPTITARFLTNA